MARIQWIGLALLSFSLTGCVAQEKYNALKLERDQLAIQLGTAQTQASSAQAKADTLERQLAALGAGDNNRNALVNNLTSQNSELERRLAELNQRYMEALNRTGPSGPLPAPLTNELQQFAAANPDLVDFDAARGIVKFKSDLTFATGSADVTEKAKGAIQRFSSILNSPLAASYELIVAGHTDNTPVVQAETKRKHPDNWYLSAHRAIAVSNELQRSSVNGRRIGVTGYADNRPIASNASESGKAQNRRVEVLILPTTASGGAVSTTPKSAAPVRPAPRPAMNKDTAVSAPRPALNK